MDHILKNIFSPLLFSMVHLPLEHRTAPELAELYGTVEKEKNGVLWRMGEYFARKNIFLSHTIISFMGLLGPAPAITLAQVHRK